MVKSYLYYSTPVPFMPSWHRNKVDIFQRIKQDGSLNMLIYPPSWIKDEYYWAIRVRISVYAGLPHLCIFSVCLHIKGNTSHVAELAVLSHQCVLIYPNWILLTQWEVIRAINWNVMFGDWFTDFSSTSTVSTCQHQRVPNSRRIALYFLRVAKLQSVTYCL